MINLKHGAAVLKGLINFVTGTRTWNIPDVTRLPDRPQSEIDKEANYVSPIETDTLISGLKRYGIDGKFTDHHSGSAVTTYEVQVPVGTKLNAIFRYRDDIARDLGTPFLRIIQSVHNSSRVGFEVENIDRYSVYFKDLFLNIPEGLKLPVILGEDTYGAKTYVDLAAMPHLLVAGRTGSGKSVFINTLITTLICRFTPDQLKLILVDPKQVEFAAYENLPHIFEQDGEPLTIASDASEAREVLEVAVAEMEHRFELM